MYLLVMRSFVRDAVVKCFILSVRLLVSIFFMFYHPGIIFANRKNENRMAAGAFKTGILKIGFTGFRKSFTA